VRSATADQWRAFHAYYSDHEHADALLIEASRLVPAPGPKPNNWFFIRYSEGGMHLRFRFLGDPPYFAEILHGVRAKLWELTGAAGEPAAVPAGSSPDEFGRFHYPGSIVETPYMAETQRYGGPDALRENEALFAFSTSLALGVIGATLDDHSKRGKLALDLMLAAATVAVDDAGNERRFFEAYSRFWAKTLLQTFQMPEGSRITGTTMAAPRLQKLREHAQSDAGSSSPSQLWLRRLAEAKRRFQDLAASGKLVSPADGKIVGDPETCDAAVSNMLMSQIHMLNNRLGVAPYTEMMWAAALARSLGR
jgi:thiopeptide-type bacteriocin biosynthesis protein